MDVLSLTPATSGHCKALVLLDHFSRNAWAVPIADETQDTIARAFIDTILIPHGAPEKILTDRGAPFMEGEQVLRRTPSSYDGRTVKLAREWQGPYRIAEVIDSNTVRLYNPTTREPDTMPINVSQLPLLLNIGLHTTEAITTTKDYITQQGTRCICCCCCCRRLPFVHALSYSAGCWIDISADSCDSRHKAHCFSTRCSTRTTSGDCDSGDGNHSLNNSSDMYH